MKWIVAIICIVVGGFCVFGFMATFEPGAPNAIAFRIGYAIIGLACLVGIVLQLVPRKST